MCHIRFTLGKRDKQAVTDPDLWQNGCDVIQAEGDDDVKIAKAAIYTFAFRPTTFIEDTDFLVFLFYHAEVSNSNALYFSSNKAKSLRL